MVEVAYNEERRQWLQRIDGRWATADTRIWACNICGARGTWHQMRGSPIGYICKGSCT